MVSRLSVSMPMPFTSPGEVKRTSRFSLPFEIVMKVNSRPTVCPGSRMIIFASLVRSTKLPCALSCILRISSAVGSPARAREGRSEAANNSERLMRSLLVGSRQWLGQVDSTEQRRHEQEGEERRLDHRERGERAEEAHRLRV